MESMRQIATAYYERSSEQEKQSAKAFFRDLDGDGDGKVSLVELKKKVPWSCISNENMFRQLDENGDGILDFFEVLAVYYMVNKVELMLCSGCYTLLSGPYFSCRLCLGNPDGTFNLCCGCYRHGKVVHDHPLSSMVDHHSLLADHRKSHAESQKTKAKREMEELRDISKAHYRAASREVQNLAYEFYQSMDTNGDGQVELSEFLEFMRYAGYLQMENPQFFHDLDLDGNGILDFSEVMMLYYIIKSGRPFCNGCNHFIPGMFFSCVECFKPPKTSFNLCRDCYPTKCSHSHNGQILFLDNYSLLEATRNSSMTQRTTASRDIIERSPIPSNAIFPAPNYPMHPAQHTNNAYLHSSSSIPYNAYMHSPYNGYMHSPYPPAPYNAHIALPPPPPPVPHHTNAVVATASNKWETCKVALQALEVALFFGSFSAAGCTIL